MARKKQSTIIESPVLPGIADLPETRDGRTPIGMKSSMSGTANRVTEVHEVGDDFYAIVKFHTTFAGHNEDTKGVHWKETYSVSDVIVPASERAREMWAAEQQLQREARGEPPLSNGETDPFAVGKAGVTDPSGVVMTPSERADAGLPPLPGEDTRTPEELQEAAKQDREVADDLAAKRAERNPGEAPYVDYADLGAEEIISRVKASTDRDFVLSVGNFEEDNRDRKSVLLAVGKRSAELLKAEG